MSSCTANARLARCERSKVEVGRMWEYGTSTHLSLTADGTDPACSLLLASVVKNWHYDGDRTPNAAVRSSAVCPLCISLLLLLHSADSDPISRASARLALLAKVLQADHLPADLWICGTSGHKKVITPGTGVWVGDQKSYAAKSALLHALHEPQARLWPSTAVWPAWLSAEGKV